MEYLQWRGATVIAALRKYRAARCRRHYREASAQWSRMLTAMCRRRPRPEHARAHAARLQPGTKRGLLTRYVHHRPGFERCGKANQWAWVKGYAKFCMVAHWPGKPPVLFAMMDWV